MAEVIWSDRVVPGWLAERARPFRVESPAGPGVPGPVEPRPDVVAVLAAYTVRYDDARLARFPNLRVLVRTGIGVDNVDIAAATRRRIVVCNTPDAPSIATAELAIALMLAVAKRLAPATRWVTGVDRPADPFQSYDGVELAGRRLALIGVGRIGR